MASIENENEFKEFMKELGPRSKNSRDNYISWLRYLSKQGFNIDRNIIETKEIIDQLKLTKRKKYTDKKDYSNFKSAINKYKEFISSFFDGIVSDLNKIESDKNLSPTEKVVLKKARLGQGKFRRDIIGLWGKCSITEVDNVEFLIASHIVPWKEANNEERLDPYNGLLLAPNYDKLFDKGFISFEECGKIILSKKLDRRIYERMGIQQSDKLYKIFNETIIFLRRHKEHFKSNL